MFHQQPIISEKDTRISRMDHSHLLFFTFFRLQEKTKNVKSATKTKNALEIHRACYE